ncbi:acetate--CoA ligase family protein [Streptomyces sp. NPDC023723]|uniref:acetate--CoA ligase family protein n=1 Tax=Streptomyces sp. NPDC023723 TaxID=3154323 RepID=UPI00340A38D6
MKDDAPHRRPAQALLTDGTMVLVRTVEQGDRRQLENARRKMSFDSPRPRLSSAGPRSAHSVPDTGCTPARRGHRALLAERARRAVGLVEYHADTDTPDVAEFAVAVPDGVTAFTADAASENHEVPRLFAGLGLSTSRRFEGSETHCFIDLYEDETHRTTTDMRGRIVDKPGLEPLLSPRAIAVVGVGRRPGPPGRALPHHLREAGHGGRLFAVNPVAEAIQGVPSYPSVSALPVIPDLAVVVNPTACVPAAAQECGKAGVRALAVVTGGLDARQTADLLTACRTHGMRLVGPDCLGVADTDPAHRFDATFAATHPRPRTAGVAAQSGGVGIALLHPESFGNPQALSRTARRVTRRMPVLTVDAGGAAAPHIAAAATGAMSRQALFTQADITATRSIGELLETAALLYAQPLPAGHRVAVLTNAVGAGVLAADACAEAGLVLHRLSPELAGDLLAVLPAGATVGNLVDATTAVSEDALRVGVDRLVSHPAADAVIVVLAPTAHTAATGDDLARAVTRGPGRRTKPVTLVRLEQDLPVTLLPAADGETISSYAEPQAAAQSPAHAAHRAARLARPADTVPDLEDIDQSRAHELADDYLARQPDGGRLDPSTRAALPDCYGIPQQPWARAETEDDAVRAAGRLRAADGRGVVLKAHWPGLVHRSLQHAVHPDLSTDTKVRAAFQDLRVRFEELMTGVVAQRLAPRGIELFAGLVKAGVLGPLVVLGSGGSATEVPADHAARLAPLTERDVHDLITALRCSPLLFGAQGSGPVDLDGLEQALHRLSRMAMDLPQLAEADFNPVLAAPGGVTVLDARISLLPCRQPGPVRRLY